MTSEEIYGLLPASGRYNLHSHTQYCDGHARADEMAEAACNAGMELWGVSPHSPIVVESPCNMSREAVKPYLEEVARLKEWYAGRMHIFTGMEIDFLSADFGPHIDYFRQLSLDYRIGSVHFVPNQEGIPIDCDGSRERFKNYLKTGFSGDLRYVVEKYYEQVLTMLERGGFEILAHFDKIAGNASAVDPEIEKQGWYEALIADVITKASDTGVLVEINTKAIDDRERFYPAQNLWGKIKGAGLPVIFNSDAHWPDKVNLGRDEAIEAYKKVIKT